MIALKLFILFLFSRAKNNSETEAEYRTAFLQLHSLTQGFAWDASQVTLMKAIILVTLEITQCALITREVKENQMTMKKANNHIQRLTAGLTLRGDKTLRIREDPDSGGGMAKHQEFKNYAWFVPSRLTSTLSPYQTFQRLPQRSEWLTQEQRVLHSSNHLSKPRARRRITPELFGCQNTSWQNTLEFCFEREGFFSPTHFFMTHPYFIIMPLGPQPSKANYNSEMISMPHSALWGLDRR